MKRRQYAAEPAKTAARRGVVEQLTGGLMAIPRGIGRTPAGIVAFVARAVAMARNPRAAAQKELEGPAGWKSIVLDFLGVIFIMLVLLTAIMAAGSLVDAKAAKALPLPLVPLAAVLVSLQLAQGIALTVLLSAGLLHLMAAISGQHGAFGRMAHLVVMVWAVAAPLILVMGVVFSIASLPPLAAYLLLNFYLIYALANVMTAAYQMPFGRAVFMAFIYQLLMGVLSFVAAQNLPTAA